MMGRSAFKPLDGYIVVTIGKALPGNFLCHITLFVVQVFYTASAEPVTPWHV